MKIRARFVAFGLAVVVVCGLEIGGGLGASAAPPSFAHSAFSRVWERTDGPVAASAVKRTWFWGPQPNTAGLSEEYKEGVGSTRLVQYFDKSRMEVNDPSADPNSPFYVTNGLLTVELISGRMQTGKASFVNREPSRTNVTGDYGDPLAPSYFDFAGVSNAGQDRRDPDRTGQQVTATLAKGGKVGQGPARGNGQDAKLVYYEKITGHNIPQVMWDFLNSSGMVSVGGQTSQQRLIEPWFYASGLPISDPYWVRATIAGVATDVMVQAYERRVLTYVPTNPDGFKVEMGNIGQHYYDWRYKQPGATPTRTAAPAASALPRYAVDIINDFSPATLDAVKASGAGAVRLYLTWSDIEPSNVAPAQYNWSVYDERLKAVSSRGLVPVTLVDGCPGWACSRTSGPIRVERMGDFVEFMEALAERYGKAPYNAHYWEMWNEPDAQAGIYNWGTHGDRYAAMLAAIRPRVKAADPNAKLVMGGVAYDNFQEDGGPFYKRFVDDVLDAGGGKNLDVFNFHYYVQNAHWCSMTGKLDELRAKLKAHNVDLPIMTTETGYTSDTKFQSNADTQSLYVTQAYAQAAGEGMLAATWFSARDLPSDIPNQDIFLKSGLLDVGGAPKPAHRAYKEAVDTIGQRRAIRALGQGDGVTAPMRGYEFAAGAGQSGPLWVVWGWDLSTNATLCGRAPAARDFTIPARLAANLQGVRDMYGQTVTTHIRPDGSTVFSLDARPVYVEWEQ
ncbi:MAG: cellulase family glycosylhydrolase [Chloroflexia bacterium]